MAGILINGKEYPMPPGKDGKGQSALELAIEGAGPIGQFIHNGQVFVPASTEASQEILRWKDEALLYRFLNRIATDYDTIVDASDLNEEKKLEECLRILGTTMKSPYAMLHIAEPAETLPQVIEMVKPNGDFVSLKDFNPSLADYFSGLRKGVEVLGLIETEKEQFKEFKLPEGIRYLKGYGITASLKPSGKLIGTIQLLNRASSLSKDEEKIMKKNIGLIDSILARALHQSGGVYVRDNSLGSLSGASFTEEIMEAGEQFEGAGDFIKREKAVANPAVKVIIDEPGMGYCRGSFFEANLKKYNERFTWLRDRLAELGLGDIEKLFEEAPRAGINGDKDYKFIRHAAMLMHSVLGNIDVGENVNGLILFPNAQKKQEISAAAEIVGATCLVPKYVDPYATKLNGKIQIPDFTAQLNEMLQFGEKNDLTIKYQSAAGETDFRTRIKFMQPAVRSYALHISENLDGKPGNNRYTDLVEAVLNASDHMLDTNAGPANTVASAIARLRNTGYDAYAPYLERVLLPQHR